MKIASFLLFLTLSGCTDRKTGVEGKTAYLPIKAGPLESQMSWRGIVRAANRIEIRADRKMKVKKILVKNFDSVKSGEPLLEVDNSETLTKVEELRDKLKAFDLEKESLKLKFDQTQKILARKRGLFKKGIVAEREHDEAVREAKVSETELKTKKLEEQKQKRELSELEAQLKAQVFLSPMNGTVANLISTEGGPNPEAQPGQLLAVVSDLGRLALWVPIEETNLHKISVGQRAQVKIDAAQGSQADGKVIEISSGGVQNNTRVKTYEVGIAFSMKDQNLREGYGGEASMVFARKESAISVPLSALKYSDGKNFVSVAAANGSAGSPREVQLGIKTDTEAEVLAGLSDGELIVIDAQ